MENIVRKEIASNKQLLLSQCFLPYMVLIFHYECTFKCRLQFVSIWTSLKLCRLVRIKVNLPSPKRKILDSRKLKELAEDNFSFDENGRKFPKWVENTVGKGEFAHF